MAVNKYLNIPVKKLVKENPILADFFLVFHIDCQTEQRTFVELATAQPDIFYEENSTTREEITRMFVDFLEGISKAEETEKIETLEIIAGTDKYGSKEQYNLVLRPGEINCIVGPTGSGKSRLLADIEWLANADTPTNRRILINGKIANSSIQNNFGGKLIAQITQNMNFILDMDVYGFLMLHAQSRFLSDAGEKVNEVIQLANELSGERFSAGTPVTFLSGGQSRALMIADVACIGQAPVVLIDEIENAGVDKKKAVDLLVNNDKIVLMATHDPLLILLAHRRIIIKNGGIHKIITTTKVEKELYGNLEKIDNTMQMVREYFRKGNELSDKEPFFTHDWLNEINIMQDKL